MAVTLVLAGCMETATSTSVEDSIAAAFPDPQDRAGIAVVFDRDGPDIFVVHYPDLVSDAVVLTRVQRYCAANGFQSASPLRVRAGVDLIQPDNSTRESRRGDYTCT
ncbi:MAG: hypothetical protein AAFU41_10855 [Pseudomonadota bacterium]